MESISRKVIFVETISIGLLHIVIFRFNDISVAIRTKCVQYSMHFLLNHPDLRKDITETLKMRQHDSDENVRYQVRLSNKFYL